MKQSPQIQARINTIAKELANGKERGELLSKYAKKWGRSEKSIDRYIVKAKTIAQTLTEKARKATEDVYIEETKEAAKNGLKSKTERVLEYQDEIIKMYQQLNGEIHFTFKVGNSIKKSHGPDGSFMVPVDIQNDIRAMIKSYKTEISKIQGDYAPAKIAETDSAGNDLHKKTDAELLERLSFLKKLK